MIQCPGYEVCKWHDIAVIVLQNLHLLETNGIINMGLMSGSTPTKWYVPNISRMLENGLNGISECRS